MKIENEIISSVIAAVKELYGQDVPEKMVALQKTKSNFEGNLTLVVFPFLKMSKKKPEDTAQEIGEYLKKNCANVIADFNVVKGFLNLSIAPAAWVGLLNTINADPKFGEKPVTENSPLVMIEYSSPNTNKPLHLGHVRNNLLGWSLAQIMEANGNKVIKTNIVNDRGIHICKSMLAWLKWGNGETPETSGKKGDLSQIYDLDLQDIVKRAASALEILIKEGTYIQLSGPQFETPHEVAMCRTLGADAVGMSTACEAIAAKHMGMKVLGISCISNLASGISSIPLSHAEVQETADAVAPKFKALVTETIKAIGAQQN